MTAPPSALVVHGGVPLAPLTSLELGGAARHLVEVTGETDLRAALAWAQSRGLPVVVLGGGSNVVVPDAGLDGLVVRMTPRGVATSPGPDDSVLVTAQAGEPWDDLVAETVGDGLAGLECLSGIPGLVGATPIQNVGAYGVEVAALVHEVEVLHRPSGRRRSLRPEECGFAYRDSRFRRQPEEHVVLSVTFRLEPGGPPVVRYPELARAVAERAQALDLPAVRATVLALRRRKSMLLDVPEDPNRRSAGSFFTNPIVPDALADAVARQAVDEGLVADPGEVPRWPLGRGRSKLAAGWLIERAGFPPGTRRGPVGVSSKHALALVHHGGGTTAALLALAVEIAEGVRTRFGVSLEREPVLLGPPPIG